MTTTQTSKSALLTPFAPPHSKRIFAATQPLRRLAMQLAQEQIDFFQTFGYLHFPALFSPDEVAWICEEFEYSIQHFGSGNGHDGSSRTMFGGPIEHRPRLCALLDDARII